MPIFNDMSQLAAVAIPALTTILVGVVADQSDPRLRPIGGNTQFFVPNLAVPAAAYETYERVREEMRADLEVAVPKDLLWTSERDVVKDIFGVDSATLRKESDEQARRENPEMTEEQLEWTWRQVVEQLGL